MATRPTAKPAASTPAPATQPPAAAAPEATASSGTVTQTVPPAPDPAQVTQINPGGNPPPADDLVPARVLSPLIHDGVSYPEGGIVALTAAQHAELSKAGAVSDEPAEGLPY